MTRVESDLVDEDKNPIKLILQVTSMCLEHTKIHLDEMDDILALHLILKISKLLIDG